MSTDTVRELETFMARMRAAAGMQLYYDSWEAHGKQFCDDAAIAEMERDFAKANTDYADAQATLERRIGELRRTAPDAIAAWADAHIAYLEEFIGENDAESTGVFVAKQEIEQWREVRIGTRTYVQENNFYVTKNKDRYRAIFGIDP